MFTSATLRAVLVGVFVSVSFAGGQAAANNNTVPSVPSCESTTTETCPPSTDPATPDVVESTPPDSVPAGVPVVAAGCVDSPDMCPDVPPVSECAGGVDVGCMSADSVPAGVPVTAPLGDDCIGIDPATGFGTTRWGLQLCDALGSSLGFSGDDCIGIDPATGWGTTRAYFVPCQMAAVGVPLAVERGSAGRMLPATGSTLTGVLVGVSLLLAGGMCVAVVRRARKVQP